MVEYVKKLVSLEERALIGSAIGLCQDPSFKGVALCLEKPTYGDFTNSFNKEKRLELWDALVDERCQTLIEKLPCRLKNRIQGWVNRIALEYLSYCRRQEVLFGISRYFMMDFLTREDWTELGRLNETRLAERLVKDERLTVLQRYRIACVYCLHADSPSSEIASLWGQLSLQERVSFSGKDDPSYSVEKNRLVLLWSYFMDRRHEKVTGRRGYFWEYAIEQAVYDGNRIALMPCWKCLPENVRQSMVMRMAFDAFYSWISTQYDRDLSVNLYKDWRKNLISNESSNVDVRRLNLPSYYSDLFCFFLSEMREEQQLTFFEKALEDKRANYVLECFLEWPHQDYFLPTVRKLWSILPKYNYGSCLLLLASKYSGDYDCRIPRIVLYKKEDRYFDYQSLLFQLWDATPENYKRYIFTNKKLSSIHRYKDSFINESSVSLMRFLETHPSNNREYEIINEGRVLLPRLLKKHPFMQKDEELFKCFLSYVPKEERIAIMHSKNGEDICSTLAQREQWSFLDWLLKECFTTNEIINFKKGFIQSRYCRDLCFLKLKNNQEIWLKNLIDWSLESNKERKEFKETLICGDNCLDACKALVCSGNFFEVERMMNFCFSSEGKKEALRVRVIEYACSFLLKNYEWNAMDKILKWYSDVEGKRLNIKKNIFSYNGIDIHCELVFEEKWEDIESFYEWFKLSQEEINKIKKETIFLPQVIQDISETLYENADILLQPLRWCLYDEEILIDFKKELKSYFLSNPHQGNEQAEKWLNYLTEKLLSDFKKETKRKEINNKLLEGNLFLPSKKRKRGADEIKKSNPRKRISTETETKHEKRDSRLKEKSAGPSRQIKETGIDEAITTAESSLPNKELKIQSEPPSFPLLSCIMRVSHQLSNDSALLVEDSEASLIKNLK